MLLFTRSGRRSSQACPSSGSDFWGSALLYWKILYSILFLSKIFPSYSLPLILLIWCWAGWTSARAMSLLTSGGGKGPQLGPAPRKARGTGAWRPWCISWSFSWSTECRTHCLWHFFPPQWKHWFHRILLGAKFYFQLLAYTELAEGIRVLSE